MDTKKRTILIVGGIITFLVVPLVSIAIFSGQTKQPDNTAPQPITLKERSDGELLKTIVTTRPELGTIKKPLISVSTSSKPASGWYVVTAYQIDDTEKTNPAKFLIHDTGGETGLTLTLGPGTYFSDDTLSAASVPTVVGEALNL